ncbi:MAG: hypothetical protein ABSB80_02610 [Methanoregula sp.]|jgi:hypothetical protein|uniref:hypothetical protein n=1 Tax=Methanoregula sp. TaxID=2052170 RepID=UPI003D0F36C9
MDIIRESVNKLETILGQSGCEDAGVLLDVDPDAVTCQFEQGACMTASFGGRSAVFVTHDPVRALTKISFMFGAPLETPAVRSAAGAIINVAAGFFCLSRILHPCPKTFHAPCLQELKNEISGKRVSCIGTMASIERELGSSFSTEISEADVILINGEGIIAKGTGDLIEAHTRTKRILCLGPSTAGNARLHEIEHWCPYGTG